MRINGAHYRTRRAQATLEFALICPLFLLLVFGSLEFGRAYLRLHMMLNAARDGARAGTLPSSVEADVESAVDERLSQAGFDTSDCSTTVAVYDPAGSPRTGGLAEAQQGDRVEVTVEYDFQVLTGTLIPGFSGIVPLHAVCTFRHE